MEKHNIVLLAALVASIVIFGVSGAALAKEGAMKKSVVIIELPKPVLKGSMSIEEAIQKRRSTRRYSDKSLTEEQISQLLWAAQGITDRRGLRAAPSAGALYPLEVYVVMASGVFHYIPKGHKLEMISGSDIRKKLAQVSWNQMFIAEAPVDIVICAVYERVTDRYGDRGKRYTDMEAGHAAENLHLQAVALGLASVPLGAFSDEAVAKILHLSNKEKPLYIIPVGHAK